MTQNPILISTISHDNSVLFFDFSCNSRYIFEMNKIKKSLVRLQNYFTQQIMIMGFLNRFSGVELERIGSDYGGWYVPQKFLEDNKLSRAAISVGIGHDVSFDRALLESGCRVIALDPLEECVDYARSELGDKFKNLNIEKLGLAVNTGFQILYPPKNPQHDAWSSTNSQNVDEVLGVQFEVISLIDLMSKYRDSLKDKSIILKMDIEGAEKNIIPEICNLSYKFDFLAIEMDFLPLIPFLSFATRIQNIYVGRNLIKKLMTSGYTLVRVENFNFFWVHIDHKF